VARRPRRTIPDRALSLSEGEKLRDQMNANEDKSTETLSTISRSLAVGLALITYSFFFEKDHSDFLTANFLALLAASALGVLALTADAMHYLFAMLQVQLMRRRIKQHLDGNGTLTTVTLDHFNRNTFYWLRYAMFWSKLILVACGAAVIIVIILRSAATLAQNNMH
jgi:hypothetical protein